jgi:hypothetical protein
MEQGKLVLSRKKGESIVFETVNGELFKVTVLEKKGRIVDFEIVADGHKLKLVDPANESVKIQVNRFYDRIFSTLKELKIKLTGNKGK